MNYSLLVLSSPASGQASHSAARFAFSLINRGHSIERVFFMDEGCHTGSGNRVLPQDELDPLAKWVQLATEQDVELILCISSAIQRGLLDDAEAQRHEKPAATVHPAFQISGLGQLVDAASKSERLVTFGG